MSECEGAMNSGKGESRLWQPWPRGMSNFSVGRHGGEHFRGTGRSGQGEREVVREEALLDHIGTLI